jgi:DNA-binding transcriptional LysR family regulator
MPSSRIDQLRVRHLRFLDTLADSGSLAATAGLMAMSPSAASMMLKEIESMFGAKLFARQGRGMAPTPQGAAMLPRCKTVLGEVGAIGATLTQAPAPLLRLGAFPHTTTTVLPGLVKALVMARPAWRVQVLAESGERLMRMLLAGDIDMLVGHVPRQVAASQSIAGLAQQVLYQGRLSVVAGRSHPVLARRKLRLEDLLEWPWVLPNLQSTTRVALVDAFLRHGLPPPLPAVEAPSFFYSLALVARTDLLTCCAHTAALHSPHATAIVPVDIGQDPTPVSLVWRTASVEAVRARHLLQPVIASEAG